MAFFDGIPTGRKDGWSPSKEGLPVSCIGSSSTQSGAGHSHIHTDVDVQSISTGTSSQDVDLPNEKRHKKNTSMNLEAELLAVINTLKNDERPTIDDCNKVLNEVQGLQDDDPLYIVASGIFCEGKAYREQWMNFRNKPDVVKLKWIEIIGKRLGFF